MLELLEKFYYSKIDCDWQQILDKGLRTSIALLNTDATKNILDFVTSLVSSGRMD